MQDQINFAPAQWIWYPSERTLANSFVLFRRSLSLKEQPVQVTGWILADSRYRLSVNGRYRQWGPAPADPRWPEADPVDLTDALSQGMNVIGVEVLFYGQGDGTWVTGKPGLIAKIEMIYADGSSEWLETNRSWFCYLDRAHPPGQYKRWYLRALQEVFDARIHPWGWDTAGFTLSPAWRPAMVLDGPAHQPTLCNSYQDYLFGSEMVDAEASYIRKRKIPLLLEQPVQVKGLSEYGQVKWLQDPEDWFQFRTPGVMKTTSLDRQTACRPEGEGWQVPAADDARSGYLLTFEFSEQIVGFPCLSVIAPEGTIIELICQESHDPAKTLWLDTHKYSWTRLICREGHNTFQAFDYESLRWLQLHIRNHQAEVKIEQVLVLRRKYPWPQVPRVDTGETGLQRLLDACINTVYNNALETIVDGNGRERQQYSGDIGHELPAIRYVLGDTRLPQRFIETYSQGLTLEGYFMDCWPAYDRIVRIPQRQLGLTRWGPILDHGIQFVFDNWHHYLETGDSVSIAESFPRIRRFASYLEGLLDKDGLLPVENLGVPWVWIDNHYPAHKYKKCAFNLYASAMYLHALAPLAAAQGDRQLAQRARLLGEKLLKATRKAFWSKQHKLFVNNLPWLAEDDQIHLCDRTLAMSVLFDQCPQEYREVAAQVLAEKPPEMGLSFPPNAGWRYQALARLGRVDVLLKEFREIWAELPSVLANNTLAEHWQVTTDSDSQWSHAAIAPLYTFYMDIAGIRPTAPGFARCQIQPQLGDLQMLSLTAHTVRGAIQFNAGRKNGWLHVQIEIPKDMDALLFLPKQAQTQLSKVGQDKMTHLDAYRLRPGEVNEAIYPDAP